MTDLKDKAGKQELPRKKNFWEWLLEKLMGDECSKNCSKK